MTLRVCFRRFWRTLPAAYIIGATAALAQSPADDFMRSQAERGLEQRLETLRQSTPGGSSDEEPKHTGQQTGITGGPCFKIDHVEVDGLTLISNRSLAAVLAAYRNKCVGLADINTLLKSITNLYMDAGYITSRVYVAEQNIAETKILRLVATEGSLSDIYLNGQPSASPGILATAFPGMKGKPVNIRDVEQGLAQINRLSSNDAKTSMLPGKEPGHSILNVDNKPGSPWHFSIGNGGAQTPDGHPRPLGA